MYVDSRLHEEWFDFGIDLFADQGQVAVRVPFGNVAHPGEVGWLGVMVVQVPSIFACYGSIMPCVADVILDNRRCSIYPDSLSDF